MSSYDDLRRRHQELAQSRLGDHLRALRWDAATLRAERDRRVRRIVAHARERSPWHARRLRGVDDQALRADDLDALPPMSKGDLMDHFDEIVTDSRLNRSVVEAHLDNPSANTYLLDTYHVIASGGSSGRRGLFVYDWHGWADFFLGISRNNVADRRADPALSAAPNLVALVAAGTGAHATSLIPRTFSSEKGDVTFERVPLTLPIAEIVDRLNAIQPVSLHGYPSALRELAEEARAGRLHIQPLRLRCGSEPLLPEIRRVLEETWNVPVHNQWVTSEAGCLAYSCFAGDGLHVSDDLAIVEPVDDSGRPTLAGQTSSKVYVTNLFNAVLPLIRFEISDQVTLREGACGCGSAHRWIADIEGRLDDTFSYAGGIRVHPLVFRAVLGQTPTIVEYQVRQTADGAEVRYLSSGEVPVTRLAEQLAGALRRAGLANPLVSFTQAQDFERLPTGKVKRFVPLP